MKNKILLVLLLLSTIGMKAQQGSLPIPKQIKNAYGKGTRSIDGKPGPKYWQNTVDYNLEVKLLPEQRMIEGNADITYFNNSPDDLQEIVIRLYGNAYAKGNTRSRYIDPRDIHEGVEIHEMMINASPYAVDDPNEITTQGTKMIVHLKKALASEDRLTMQIRWKQQIPSYTRERTGAYDSIHQFFSSVSASAYPIMLESHLLGEDYGSQSYMKPAGVLAILHQYLGEEVFLECQRAYVERWAEKSPTPFDFFNTFENISDENLNWIWKPWFFDMGHPDIAIHKVSGGKVEIVNRGNKPLPVFLVVKYEDGSIDSIDASAGIWKDGNNSAVIKVRRDQRIKYIHVNRNMSDAEYSNNYYPSVEAFVVQ